jgi:hypothetical protein
MGSVPKPASVVIRGLDDEMEVARSSPERLRVWAFVQWREAEQVPNLLSHFAEIPGEPIAHDFEVLRRDDGKYTLIPKDLQYVEYKDGYSLYDFARQGKVELSRDYIEYVTNIIKQYQPDFDYSRSEEEAHLLLGTLERINKVRESLDDLQKYLWYSNPGKNKAVPPIRDPDRDVKAAVLHDAFDLNTFQIGEILEYFPPYGQGTQSKHEHAAVRLAAQRGRELLHYHFGAKEWKQKAERIRALRGSWSE